MKKNHKKLGKWLLSKNDKWNFYLKGKRKIIQSQHMSPSFIKKNFDTSKKWIQELIERNQHIKRTRITNVKLTKKFNSKSIIIDNNATRKQYVKVKRKYNKPKFNFDWKSNKNFKEHDRNINNKEYKSAIKRLDEPRKNQLLKYKQYLKDTKYNLDVKPFNWKDNYDFKDEYKAKKQKNVIALDIYKNIMISFIL